MPPLVGIAISMLPGLAKRVADNVIPDVEDRITRTVRDVLGTDDPQKAEELIANPKIAAELRVKLAQIEADAEIRQAEIEQRQRETQLEKIKVDLDAFRAEITDKASARSMLTELSSQKSAFAWGSVVVSIIVTGGFFWALWLLVSGNVSAENNSLLQIVNIVIGALTAGFATVISFWLGSSQGSRNKDENFRVQNIATMRREERDQARETALIERVAPTQTAEPPAATGAATAPPPAASPVVTKGPRHFHDCMELIFEHEGGYVDHPKDPGGATNLGITHKTLAAFRGLDKVTRDDVKALSHDEAREIYRLEYWNKLNCDSLPAGVDLVTFDFGVNAGPARSAKMLQDIVAAKVDGQIGTRTLASVESFRDVVLLINTFSDRRLSYYKSLSDLWPTFGRGWTSRTEKTRKAALAAAEAAAAAT